VRTLQILTRTPRELIVLITGDNIVFLVCLGLLGMG